MPDARAFDAEPFDGGVPMDAGPCTEDCGIVEVALGRTHTCARRDNGEVLCWGDHRAGQLGDGRLGHGLDCAPDGEDPQDCSDVPVSAFTGAVSLSARGDFSTCAQREDGTAWCWGAGEIPDDEGFRPVRLAPVEQPVLEDAQQISDGDHVCVVTETDRVGCFGVNDLGQLGDGSTTTREDLVDPGLSGVDEVQVGGAFSCARVGTTVRCWGSNGSGEIGDGVLHASCGFPAVDCATTPSGDLAVPAVRSISLGFEHGCAVTSDRGVYCWGSNARGQLGVGDLSDRAVPSVVPGLANVLAITAGDFHTCALDDLGVVRCWGANDRGQLGDGESTGHNACPLGIGEIDCALSPVVVTTVDDATAIAAGGDHTCALRPGGEVWCWGADDRHQLGDDDERSDSDEPVQAVVPFVD